MKAAVEPPISTPPAPSRRGDGRPRERQCPARSRDNGDDIRAAGLNRDAVSVTVPPFSARTPLAKLPPEVATDTFVAAICEFAPVASRPRAPDPDVVTVPPTSVSVPPVSACAPWALARSS